MPHKLRGFQAQVGSQQSCKHWIYGMCGGSLPLVAARIEIDEPMIGWRVRRTREYNPRIPYRYNLRHFTLGVERYEALANA